MNSSWYLYPICFSLACTISVDDDADDTTADPHGTSTSGTETSGLGSTASAAASTETTEPSAGTTEAEADTDLGEETNDTSDGTVGPGTTVEDGTSTDDAMGNTEGEPDPEDWPEYAVVWSEDFENGFSDDWSVEGGVWQIGEPTDIDGPEAFAGAGVAATVLDGDYPTNAEPLLVTHEFEVAEVDVFPRLRLWQWHALSNDRAEVLVSVDGGAWQDLAPERVRLYGTGEQWSQRIIHLSAYAGERIRVGFRLDSGSSGVAPGWYLDEVSYETGAWLPFTGDDFEGEFGDWSVANGVWALGTPEVGPEPFEGIGVFGTVLSGTYPTNRESRLESQVFVVPGADSNPTLWYQQWFELSNDAGHFEVRDLDDDGIWTEVRDARATGSSGGWSPGSVDLSDYARHTIQVGFRLESGSSGVAEGWYIDSVTLVTR